MGVHDVGARDAQPSDANARDLALFDAEALSCAPFEVPIAGGGSLGVPPTPFGPGTSCHSEGFHIASEEAETLEAQSALLRCGTLLHDVGSSCAFVRSSEPGGLTVEQWNQICDLEQLLGPREWFCWFVGD